MALGDDIFKHFELNEKDTVSLIEMWKHFHPKDEPYIRDSHTLFVNKAHPEVSPYQFIHVVKDLVLSNYWKDRFYSQSFNTRLRNPMDILNEHFVRLKGPEIIEEKPKEDGGSAKVSTTKKTRPPKKVK